MDPVVRTSFIPKKPVMLSNATVRQSGVGIFFILTLMIFLGSVLLAGGAFAYERYLIQSIKAKSASLDRARGAFEPATIANLVRLDKRLNQARVIIDGHTAPSAVFSLLSKATLVNVAFDKFDLTTGPDGKGLIALSGKTNTFSEVALQSDVFNHQAPFKDVFKEVIFSGFTVAKEGGVQFSVNAMVDSAVINYRNNLAIEGTPSDAPIQTVAPQNVPQATTTKQTTPTTPTAPKSTTTN